MPKNARMKHDDSGLHGGVLFFPHSFELHNVNGIGDGLSCLAAERILYFLHFLTCNIL